MINCNCNYVKFSDGQVIHSINCEKSNLFNLENRHGFASMGIIDAKKDYELIKQQVEKLQAELAEKDKATIEAKLILHDLFWINRHDRGMIKDWLEKYGKQKDEVKE